MIRYICPKWAIEKFNYNKWTGMLTLKDGSDIGREHWCGGKGSERPYIQVNHDGREFLCHRIIWVMVTGEQPDTIDHKDGNGLNNKWDNIRSVSHGVNMTNKRIYENNTSGCAGVHMHKRSGKWVARIAHKGKRIVLGTFEHLAQAVEARKEAEVIYNYGV